MSDALLRRQLRELLDFPHAHANFEQAMREALLIADRNAYHIGQMVTLRQLLGIWPPPT